MDPPPNKAEVAAEIYDSDEEAPPEVAALPAWRLDAAESLSDWTIEIVFDNEETEDHIEERGESSEEKKQDQEKVVKSYHVHKQNLAVGPFSSQYFAQVFRDGGRFAESNDATSRISLHPLTARHFETLLDYLYTGKLPLTTDNATALCSMAKYFDMRRLRWEAKEFWRADLKKNGAKVCALYYEHALILKEAKVLEAASKSCAHHIMKLKADTCRLVTHIREPTVWLAILGMKPNAVSTEMFSQHMSTLIAAFVHCNVEHIDAATFQELTDPDKLPCIHPEAAMDLIDAERLIAGHEGQGELSTLQTRCTSSLAKNWKSIDLQEKGKVLLLAQKQSPLVLTKILGATLMAAQADHTSTQAELTSTKTKLQSIKTDHQSTKCSLQNSQYSLSISQRNLSDVRRKLNEAQLKCDQFVPVPQFQRSYQSVHDYFSLKGSDWCLSQHALLQEGLDKFAIVKVFYCKPTPGQK